MVVGILLLLLGVFAASSEIIRHRPDAEPIIKFLTPIEDTVGAAAAAGGGVFLVVWLLRFGLILEDPISYIINLAVAGLMVGLGVIVGFDLLREHVFSRNVDVMHKADETKTKVEHMKVPGGYAAIALGALSIAASILI